MDISEADMIESGEQDEPPRAILPALMEKMRLTPIQKDHPHMEAKKLQTQNVTAEKGLSLKTTSIIMMIVSLVITAVLLFMAFRTFRSLGTWKNQRMISFKWKKRQTS